MNRRVAVIEDSPQEAAKLASYFKQYQKEKGCDTFEIVHFSSAESFLSEYTHAFELVLMDIVLPGMNGMEAAIKLRRIDPMVTLVFVTNMPQFAVRGYEVDAFDFIVKPVHYPHFSMKMNRIMGRLNRTLDRHVLLRFSDGMLRLPISHITYIEVLSHKLQYHTLHGTHVVYGSLKQAEEALAGEPFARCNNCYLVNLSQVRAVEGFTVNVCGEMLQISRSKRKSFLESLNIYLGENI